MIVVPSLTTRLQNTSLSFQHGDHQVGEAIEGVCGDGDVMLIWSRHTHHSTQRWFCVSSGGSGSNADQSLNIMPARISIHDLEGAMLLLLRRSLWLTGSTVVDVGRMRAILNESNIHCSLLISVSSFFCKFCNASTRFVVSASMLLVSFMRR